MWSLLIVTALTLAEGAPRTDWPQFGGIGRDFHSAETGFSWKWPAEGPPVAWKQEVGPGFAGAVVAGQQVFLFHRVENDDVLVSYNPATGKENWRWTQPTRYVDDFGFDEGPRCTPVVAGNRVVLYSAEGNLTVVDITTRKKIWSRNLRTDYAAAKGYFGNAAGPIVIGERLLVNVGGKGAGIVAFELSTGKELWKATDDPASYSSPAFTDKGAAFLTRSGLVAVSSDGQSVVRHPWRARIDASVNAASPLVRGDEVLLTSSYSTGAILLKLADGKAEEIWSNDTSISAHYNTPVRVGEYVYGIHGRQEGGSAKLRCIEWKTGAVKWNVDNFGCASLIAVEGGLLAINDRGTLIRFEADEKAYRETARAQVIDGVVRAVPALAGGQLYIRNEKTLIAIKLK